MTHFIIGLGNPGKKYEKNRHNVGFMVLDAMAKNLKLTWRENKKFNAAIAEDGDTLLVKPLCFMNNSGQTAQAVLSYYHLLPKKLGLLKTKNSDLTKILTIIHDDLDIEIGKYKVAVDSGSAGHNGVGNIIKHLKTKKMHRFRIGIKNEFSDRLSAEKFVLDNFSRPEEKKINEVIEKIIDEIKKPGT